LLACVTSIIFLIFTVINFLNQNTIRILNEKAFITLQTLVSVLRETVRKNGITDLSIEFESIGATHTGLLLLHLAFFYFHITLVFAKNESFFTGFTGYSYLSLAFVYFLEAFSVVYHKSTFAFFALNSILYFTVLHLFETLIIIQYKAIIANHTFNRILTFAVTDLLITLILI